MSLDARSTYRRIPKRNCAVNAQRFAAELRRAEFVRQLVERSVGTQGLPARVADEPTLRAVAIVMAHQPNTPEERTSAASDRARSEKEDDRGRRPRKS